MAILQAGTSALALIDFQARLMPAIDRSAEVIAKAARLRKSADILGIPVIFTEQLPHKLGETVSELERGNAPLVEKSAFDCCRAGGFEDHLPAGSTVVVAGCEAHVCVLQTVLGLMAGGRQVAVVADATGSRNEANRLAAIDRMRAHGADIVTTEMVLFEWMGDAGNPHFREIMAFIK